MKKHLSILAFCCCVTACIYPYTPELDEAPGGILSVDANITIGEISSVRLGTLYSLFPSGNSSEMDSYALPNFSGAKVWLEDETGGTYQGYTNGPSSDPSGYLTSSSSFDYMYGGYYDATSPVFYIDTKNVPGDRKYRLCINALGNTYTSDWSDFGEPPVISDIQFMADDQNVTVAVSLEGGPDATGYALLSFDETWRFHVDYIPMYTVTPRPGGSFSITETGPDDSKYWCWRSQNNYRTFPLDYTSMSTDGVTNWPLQRFPRYDNRNHQRYTVNVKAKTISKSTYRFLKNLEETSSGGDNLFSPTPGEIASNLHCESDPDRMVLGYVIFSKSVSRRAWMNSQFYKGRPSYYSLFWLLPDLYKIYYEAGYTVLEHTDSPREGEGEYGWGPAQCYDCTAAGGTLIQPDFWEY